MGAFCSCGEDEDRRAAATGGATRTNVLPAPDSGAESAEKNVGSRIEESHAAVSQQKRASEEKGSEELKVSAANDPQVKSAEASVNGSNDQDELALQDKPKLSNAEPVRLDDGAKAETAVNEMNQTETSSQGQSPSKTTEFARGARKIFGVFRPKKKEPKSK